MRANEVKYHVFRNPRALGPSCSREPRFGPLPEGMQRRNWKPLKGELRACISSSLPNVREATEEMMHTCFVRHEMTRILRRPPSGSAGPRGNLVATVCSNCWQPGCHRRIGRRICHSEPSCQPVSVQWRRSGGTELATRVPVKLA